MDAKTDFDINDTTNLNINDNRHVEFTPNVNIHHPLLDGDENIIPTDLDEYNDSNNDDTDEYNDHSGENIQNDDENIYNDDTDENIHVLMENQVENIDVVDIVLHYHMLHSQFVDIILLICAYIVLLCCFLVKIASYLIAS